MVVFTIKRGDLLPHLDAVLVNQDQTPVNLTGATVKFIMRIATALTAKVDAAATVIDAPTGQVRYTWAGTDTDTAAVYRAEFEVTLSGKKQTFPVADYFQVRVVQDLG